MSLDALVAQYLVCLQAEGKTPHTLRWHKQSLKQFGVCSAMKNGPTAAM
jgi:hypothetical protein